MRNVVFRLSLWPGVGERRRLLCRANRSSLHMMMASRYSSIHIHILSPEIKFAITQVLHI